ncbi:hypothetical protein CAEBREN_08559 [Caenorhabditis brenneri]|uniref:Uncharacterized protein n=1 Tax=Caenorhabditis brenneri TaxID=135651 RepID=G0N2Q5_CAEBE|nr:hypothetical protein CAEBREN_08559 [Caenorhabditis brenneri]
MEEFQEVTDPEELSMVMSTMNYWDDTNVTDNHFYQIEDECSRILSENLTVRNAQRSSDLQVAKPCKEKVDQDLEGPIRT